MKSLVTGATGFVGSAVAHALVNAGRDVRVIVRPTSRRENLGDLDVEVYEGDLTDPASLRAALNDCDQLFHVAADYRLWARDPQQIYRSNVDGTINIMDAAHEAGVRKIVYTSSVATLGLTADGSAANEDTPTSIEQMVGPYKRSKYLAEQEVINRSRQSGLPVVIVNPSAPIGPRDRKPTPTGRMILDAAAGRMPAYVDTGLNIVHVDDVAQGHLLAAERGRLGERYILGESDMHLKEILTLVAEVAGQKPPRIRLPHAAVMPVAWVSEAIARFTGIEPRVTVDGVRLAKKTMFFSSQKAIDQLGYRPRAARNAVEDAVSFFRENGYL
jgi:dihydroflavonol-4-reductase